MWSGSGEMRLTGGFGIVLAAFGYWDLGVGILWRWVTLGYCY